MKQQIFNALCIAAALLIASWGCNKDTQSSYVSLSDSACSFNYDGGTATVVVQASSKNWHAEYESNWLSVETGSNTLTITAEPNTETRERQCIISVIDGTAAAALTIYQVGNDLMPVFYRYSPTNIFSPNAKYAGGISEETSEDGTYQFYMVLLDLAADEHIKYGPFSDSYSFDRVRAVADNGTMYLSQGLTALYIFDRKTGTITKFDDGNIYSCSSDGSVAVGFKESTYSVDGSFPYWPYKWTNGVAEKLPLPEMPYRGSHDTDPYWYGGCIARGISADGKVIYGTEWQANDNYMIWWDEDNNWHYVGEDIRDLEEIIVTDESGEEFVYIKAKGIMNQASTTAISNKGTWICGWYVEHVVNNDSGALEWKFYPGFYNTVQNKTYIFRDYPDGRAIYAREDGIGFISTNSAMYQQDDSMRDYFTVDIESLNTLGTTQEWFFDNYGIYPPAKSSVRGFSDDFSIALFENAYAVIRR